MLQSISLENIIYITLGLSLICVGLIIWNIRIEIKNRRLLRGKHAQNLEDSFTYMQREIDALQQFQKEIETYLRAVEQRLSSSIRGVSTTSFNAFQGLESGGKSFATALLDEKGNGIIISSLQARDRLSIFTKQVKAFKADVELSEEETYALTKAKESCSL